MGAKPAKIRQIFRRKTPCKESSAAGVDGAKRAANTKMRLPSVLNIRRLADSKLVEEEMMVRIFVVTRAL